MMSSLHCNYQGCCPTLVLYSPGTLNFAPSAAQDADSYMMGQRAALMDAFRLAMPAQQQMGSMSSGLQRLQAQVRARSLLFSPG